MKLLYLCMYYHVSTEVSIDLRKTFQCKLIHRWLDDKLFPEFADVKLMKELFVGCTHPGPTKNHFTGGCHEKLFDHPNNFHSIWLGVEGWVAVAAWRCKQGKSYLVIEGWRPPEWISSSWKTRKKHEETTKFQRNLEEKAFWRTWSRACTEIGRSNLNIKAQCFPLKFIDLFAFPVPRKK